jgi:hypothetical protein
MPTGLTAALSTATSPTLQVWSSSGHCIADTLTEILRQTPTLFKAR